MVSYFTYFQIKDKFKTNYIFEIRKDLAYAFGCDLYYTFFREAK